MSALQLLNIADQALSKVASENASRTASGGHIHTASWTPPALDSNGTSPAKLMQEYKVAVAAIRAAIKALESMTVHGRDYVTDNQVFKKAQSEQLNRLKTLHKIEEEIQSIWQAVLKDADKGLGRTADLADTSHKFRRDLADHTDKLIKRQKSENVPSRAQQVKDNQALYDAVVKFQLKSGIK